MRSFVLGFATGLPFMLVIGPIAVLLLQTGLGHGFRRGWTAALGVATADLTFATLATVGGRGVIEVTTRWGTEVRLVATLVLAAVGLRLLLEVRSALPAGGPVAAAPVALATRFYVMTLLNPLTIVAFASLVVASGRSASGAGWVLGVTAASLVVQSTLVATGAGLGQVIGPRGHRQVRFVGATAVLVMAVVFAFKG